MTNHENLVYDYTFIGIGAANSLILMELLKIPDFSNKKIAIIDSSYKVNNDKTYCFWAEPNSPIVQDLTPVISRHYSKVSINDVADSGTGKQWYFYIKSIDLYQHVEALVQRFHIKRYHHKVDAILSDHNVSVIHTNSGTICSRYVFDSRTPDYPPNGPNEIYLEQSFLGLYIQVEQPVFDVETFEMMNFDVDQDKFTQFVYLLPFSENTAMIELTRFGKEKIEESYARRILHDKISRLYGNYAINGVEFGSIPMTTQTIPGSTNKQVLHTGAKANLIKPSTGYAFKNMYEFAKITAVKVAGNQLMAFNEIGVKAKKRFRFYDHLLLIILQFWPNQGKKIFSQLFKHQSADTIFSFLDGKTSFWKDLSIFYSLNWLPFLRALMVYLVQNTWLRYWIAILVVVCYHVLNSIDFNLAQNFNYAIVAAGFIIVGLPHGAVDHLLYSRQTSTALFVFICKYLLIVAIGFAFWYLFPLLSLVVFIGYSAFHFGESETVNIKQRNHASLLKNVLMGFLILSFIIISHLVESLNTIASIIKAPVLSILKTDESSLLIMSILALIIVLLVFLKRSGNQSIYGLLLVLILGIKAPLLMAFSLYFVIQHSCNAWIHMCQGLSINSMSLYKKGLPYLLAALLIGAVMLIVQANNIYNVSTIVSTLFIFISCISFPHFVIMHIFYKSND